MKFSLQKKILTLIRFSSVAAISRIWPIATVVCCIEEVIAFTLPQVSWLSSITSVVEFAFLRMRGNAFTYRALEITYPQINIDLSKMKIHYCKT